MGSIRREASISLGDEQYQVRLPFAFIDKVNGRMDLTELSNKVFAEGRALNHSECAWLIFCALSVNGERVSYEEVGQQVQDDYQAAIKVGQGIISVAMFGAPKEPVAGGDKDKSEKK